MLFVVTFILFLVFLTDSACFYIGLFANGEAFDIDTTLRSLYYIYSKGYLFKRIRLCNVCLCVSPGDVRGGSVRHTFRVPGTRFPWDKIQERGWNTATVLIVVHSLSRENKCKTNVAQEPVDRCASPCHARENCFSRSK